VDYGSPCALSQRDCLMEDFLQLSRIHKSFFGVHALKGVDLSIKRGEAHCLVGENGSGKSTLIKIISGVLQPDQGEIILEGQPVKHLGSRQTTSRGIQVIYQDLSLFPNLTVAENIAFSHLEEQGRNMIDWKEINHIATQAMQRIKIEIPLGTLVGDLPIGLQQMVAICRALTCDLKLLILDEPTASLTKRDIDNLLSVVRDLQSEGIAILFVSHKLSEVFAIAERITILRDGESVGTLPSADVSNDKLIALMTGKTVEETRFRWNAGSEHVLLEVRSLSLERNFKDISFKLHAGEIVGVAGLIGSGRTELACALFGINPADDGQILVENKPVRIGSVQDAVGAGIAYVPENRLVQGLFMRQSVADNVVATILSSLLGKFGLLDMSKRQRTIADSISQLEIKVSNPAVAVSTLSGGNQQRVVIAKWLAAAPKILILDGPTVGIDVVAKSAILYSIRALAGRGLGVILISDDITELVNNSNRILVMRAGRIKKEIATDGIALEKIQKYVEDVK
jgi:simple sugar transport system ATP-binding protein